MSAEPLFVAAVCALVRRQGKVLAMLRSRTKDASPGIWEAISGRIQAGESPLDAVRREIQEESGLEVRVDPRPLSAHQSVRAGVPMLIVYYLAEHVSGEVRMSEEHEDFAWLDAETFAARTPIEPLARAVREVLARGPA